MSAPSYTSGHAYRMLVDAERESRSSEQNRKMWALLTEFAGQVEHYGHHWSPEDWKYILLHAFGKEMRLLPGLDGSLVPVLSSSALSKSDMMKFIEFIYAEGTQRGVKFADDVADHAR
jgi:NinB protein